METASHSEGLPGSVPGATSGYSVPTEKEIIVLGAGGHAKVILSMLLVAGARVAGIYDDDPAKRGTMVFHVPVLGSISELKYDQGRRYVIGVGDNTMRHHIAARFPAVDWLTVVHPKAYVHPSCSLGVGSVVVAGAVIQSGVRVGRHCIINTGATVDQDCVIGDFCHLGPGCSLSHAVTVSEGVFMGINSAATSRLGVGAWTTLGAGGLINSDLPGGVLAVGAPATVRRSIAR
jgi:sugar O-acyltransferase (sialic acid O-acetyltransferase NeuD family)